MHTGATARRLVENQEGGTVVGARRQRRAMLWLAYGVDELRDGNASMMLL